MKEHLREQQCVFAEEFDDLAFDIEEHVKVQNNNKLPPDTSGFACHPCNQGFDTLRELFLHMVSGMCPFLEDQCINTVIASKDDDLSLLALNRPANKKRAIFIYRHSSKPNFKIHIASSNSNPHADETIDIAEDLFAKGTLDQDTELVTVCGYDANSQRTPTFYDNVIVQAFFTARLVHDATSDQLRDLLSTKRFFSTVLHGISDAVVSARNPIMIVIEKRGNTDSLWTCLCFQKTLCLLIAYDLLSP